ncbi:hypothetical protein L6R46_22915 [Myxococcota bacterium]|nr:hypothetical protein [Myxococcota bacterium]
MTTPQQAREQIVAAQPSRRDLLNDTLGEQALDAREGLGVHEGLMRVGHKRRRLASAVFSLPPPQLTQVSAVAQKVEHEVRRPLLAFSGGDPFPIEHPRERRGADPTRRVREDAAHQRGLGVVEDQTRVPGPALGALYAVTVWDAAADPLSLFDLTYHPAFGVLGEVLAVVLVHHLDEALHEAALRRVVHALVQRGDRHAALAEEILVKAGVLAVAGKA